MRSQRGDLDVEVSKNNKREVARKTVSQGP